MTPLVWQPNQALRYMVEGFHGREYWHDSNRTHAREFVDCTDDMCVSARQDLERAERGQAAIHAACVCGMNRHADDCPVAVLTR